MNLSRHPYKVGAVLIAALVALNAFAQSKTITVTAGDVEVHGGRVAFLPDAGCIIQPECRTAHPEVRCDATPQAFNRAGCGALRIAMIRAATIDVGVSDGGIP